MLSHKKLEVLINRTSIVISLLLTCGLSSTPGAYADANPTVSITTPSSTVKGLFTVNATAAADPSGTATLTRAGIKISLPNNYDIRMDGSAPNYSSYTFGSAGTADYAFQSSGSNYTFTFDTTAWPTGTYQVTVYTMDSNGRAAASSPITLIVPVSLSLSLKQTSYKSKLFSIAVVGIDNINVGDGKILISYSTSKEGPWNPGSSITGKSNTYSASLTYQPGTWVRVELTGSKAAKDAISVPIQLLAVPTLTCKFPSSVKEASSFQVTCSIADLNDPTYARIVYSSDGYWSESSKYLVSGKSINLKASIPYGGKYQVRVALDEVAGKYSQAASSIQVLSVTSTITCYKNKSSLNVSGVNPNCPSGYSLNKPVTGTPVASWLKSLRSHGWIKDPSRDLTGSGSLDVYLYGNTSGSSCGVWTFSSSSQALRNLQTGLLYFPNMAIYIGSDPVSGQGIMLLADSLSSNCSRTVLNRYRLARVQ